MENTVSFTSGFVFAILAAASLAAADLDDVKSAASSVVKVRAEMSDGTEVSGTGFVWNNQQTIVTALHLVINSKPEDIKVHFEVAGATRAATLVSGLKKSDLAILKVSYPPDVPVLESAQTPAKPGETLRALGFPLGVPSMNSVKIEVRDVGPVILGNCIPEEARNRIAAFGIPDVDLAVVNIQGPLLPGHSGAPIFRTDGKVVPSLTEVWNEGRLR